MLRLDDQQHDHFHSDQYPTAGKFLTCQVLAPLHRNLRCSLRAQNRIRDGHRRKRRERRQSSRHSGADTLDFALAVLGGFAYLTALTTTLYPKAAVGEEPRRRYALCLTILIPDITEKVAAVYAALRNEILGGSSTTADIRHSVRLTHLIDAVMLSVGTGLENPSLIGRPLMTNARGKEVTDFTKPKGLPPFCWLDAA